MMRSHTIIVGVIYGMLMIGVNGGPKRVETPPSSSSSSSSSFVSLTGVIYHICETVVDDNGERGTAYEMVAMRIQGTESPVVLYGAKLKHVATGSLVKVSGIRKTLSTPKQATKDQTLYQHWTDDSLTLAGDDDVTIITNLTLPRRRRRRASNIHQGDRKILILCVKIRDSTTGQLIAPSHCDNQRLQTIFSSHASTESMDSFYRSANWNHIRFSASNVDVAEVTVDAIGTADGCDTALFSQKTDLVAAGITLTKLKRGTVCRDTLHVLPTSHGYDTPERCALRCLCDVATATPSGVRMFSIDAFDVGTGKYSCRCSRVINSTTCHTGFFNTTAFDTYTFTVDQH